MRTLSFALLLVMSALVRRAPAQATSITEPPQNYILRIKQQWGAASRLGALSQRVMGPDDVELRVWGGYGLAGTGGFVMRWTAGPWQAWDIRQVHCRLEIPIPVGDTASAATNARFVARAHRKCNTSLGDTRNGASIVTADTIALHDLPASELDTIWTRAVAAGVRTIPPQIERQSLMFDGTTYVIELREGDVFRANVVGHVDKPEDGADRQVEAVYAAMVSVLDPPQLPCDAQVLREGASAVTD